VFTFRAVAHALWGDQNRWPEVRHALSTQLLGAVDNAEPWTNDSRYTQIQRVDVDGRLIQIRECTPREYATDMLEAGLFGHQGSEAEWHIAARAFDLNIVTLTRPAGGDDSRPAIERYPVQQPGEVNAVGVLPVVEKLLSTNKPLFRTLPSLPSRNGTLS